MSFRRAPRLSWVCSSTRRLEHEIGAIGEEENALEASMRQQPIAQGASRERLAGAARQLGQCPQLGRRLITAQPYANSDEFDGGKVVFCQLS